MKQNTALLFIVIISLFIAVQPALAQAQQQSPTLVLISNVNIFDGKTETLQKDMHVLVEGNLIKQISKEPLMVIQTDNVTIIDGGGRTLMPGLTDCHWHSMAAYMTWDPFCGWCGQTESRGGPWGRKDAYAGLHHSERRGRPCI